MGDPVLLSVATLRPLREPEPVAAQDGLWQRAVAVPTLACAPVKRAIPGVRLGISIKILLVTACLRAPVESLRARQPRLENRSHGATHRSGGWLPLAASRLRFDLSGAL
jgi:hypothetical protein